MSKNIFNILGLFLLFINSSAGQVFEKDEFIEVGLRVSKFIDSSFLINSRFRNQIKDPNVEIEGLKPSTEGKNYSLRFRYGNLLTQKTFLVNEIGFAARDEQAICFCHVCDKIAISNSLTTVFSLDAGVGLRHFITSIKDVTIFVEGMSNLSITTNESNLFYVGYSVHPILQYDLFRNLELNIKLGVEQSFIGYQKLERYFEIGFLFRP